MGVPPTEALLEVTANLYLDPISPLTEDPNLFNPEFRLAELNSITAITTNSALTATKKPSVHLRMTSRSQRLRLRS